MLVSLAIRNFVLIEDAELQFGPGLTVLTGETGAGKTLLTRALGLLAGERAEEGLVGPAAAHATVQAVFAVDPVTLAGIPADIRELVGRGEDEIIITRRLSAQGRNRCFINDTTVTLAALEEVVGGLLSFSGQHEYRRLLEPGYQLAVLDEWGGPDVVELAQRLAAAVQCAQAIEQQLTQEEEARETRLRELDFLRFQVKELTDAALSEEEEAELAAEQRRLARAEDLLRAVAAAAVLLGGDDGESDAGSLLARAEAQLAALAGVDAILDAHLEELREVEYRIADLSHALHGYLGSIAVDPERLAAVDERLQRYTELGRKYGGNTSAALAYLRHAREELDRLEHTEENLAALHEAREREVATALELAAELGERRREAAPRLERAVTTQLAELGMPGASFQVAFTAREGWEGLRETGAESVEFLLAANPNLPPRSLARTASGGELSRVLLALKCALAGAGGSETLVLDEIDAGIGGRTAVAVGQKLRELATRSQVIVVTHLAPVAALATRHYVVDKTAGPGPVSTRLRLVEGEAAAEELCRMLGGQPGDAKAMAHARDLQRRAARN